MPSGLLAGAMTGKGTAWVKMSGRGVGMAKTVPGAACTATHVPVTAVARANSPVRVPHDAQLHGLVDPCALGRHDGAGGHDEDHEAGAEESGA